MGYLLLERIDFTRCPLEVVGMRVAYDVQTILIQTVQLLEELIIE